MKTVDTKHLETKSDAKREAEAMARLRGSVVLTGIHVATVRAADLRALLDAHDRWRNDCIDAVTALAALRDSVTKTDRRDAVRQRDAVLAKARRR